MRKIFFNTILSFTLILSALIPFNYGIGLIVEALVGQPIGIQTQINRGVISQLESTLANLPQKQWPQTLKQLQAKNTRTITTISLKRIKLSKQKRKELLSGQIITQNKVFGFAGLYISYLNIYQRIGQTTFALRLQDGDTIPKALGKKFNWMQHLIFIKLKHSAAKSWETIIEKLANQYQLPLSLIDEKSGVIPHAILLTLQHKHLAYQLSGDNNQRISTIYLRTPDASRFLQVRLKISLAYSMGTSIMWIIVTLNYLLAICIVILLCYLFIRNLKKIYEMTKHYSQANFDYLPKLGRLSMLKDMYNNVASMGNKIKHLIRSQHNMMRFVAHEVRTPLTTMQFAIDRLKAENSLSKNATAQVDSLNEDIDQLNQLVSSFLLHSQNTTYELTLIKEKKNLTDWLKKALKRYYVAQVKINVTLPETKISVNFDPRLLKHVIDNLISNAIKHAVTKVEVSVALSKDSVIIFVDDDGQGIPEENKTLLFEPFTTLNNEPTLHKHMGLGLSIAKAITQLHNGEVLIEDSPLGGARFSLILPLAIN